MLISSVWSFIASVVLDFLLNGESDALGNTNERRST